MIVNDVKWVKWPMLQCSSASLTGLPARAGRRVASVPVPTSHLCLAGWVAGFQSWCRTWLAVAWGRSIFRGCTLQSCPVLLQRAAWWMDRLLDQPAGICLFRTREDEKRRDKHKTRQDKTRMQRQERRWNHKTKRREKREGTRLKCVSRLIEGTFLATLVRRWGLTHPPPTICDSQPDHHQNVHYSTGKSDDEPIQKQIKPAQNVHFSSRNPGVPPQILSTREKKKRNNMKKEETFFLSGKTKRGK